MQDFVVDRLAGSQSSIWGDPFAVDTLGDHHHHHTDQGTSNVVGQHKGRCYSSGHEEDHNVECYCLIGHEEVPAYEETSGEVLGS